MKKIGLIFFGAGLALISVELAGHRFPETFHFKIRRYVYAPDSELGYVWGPRNAVRPASSVYAVAVGDSFTRGTAALDPEEMYPPLVAKALGETVVNLGCPGYGTLQEEIVAGENLRSLKPKWLILEIFPGNDWLDNYDFTHWRLSHREVPYELHHKIVDDGMSCEGPLYPAHVRLVGRSVLYTVVYTAVIQLRRAFSLAHDWYRADSRADEIGKYQGFAAIRRLQSLCARNHVKLLVLLVRGRSAQGEMNPGFAAIRRFLNENRVEFVDPSDEFMLAQRGGQELFLPDGHWNGAGQMIAARLISRKIHDERAVAR